MDTWKCDICNSDKQLQKHEICECGCGLDLEEDNLNIYEIEELLDQIDNLVDKVRKFIK